jgi:hypothetical protein
VDCHKGESRRKPAFFHLNCHHIIWNSNGMLSNVLLLTSAFLICTPMMAASPAAIRVNPAISPAQTQVMEISRYIFRLTSSRNMLMQMAGTRSDEL